MSDLTPYYPIVNEAKSRAVRGYDEAAIFAYVVDATGGRSARIAQMIVDVAMDYAGRF